MDLLKWVLGILALLWLAWVITGGPASERKERPFLRPPIPLGSGEIYGPESLLQAKRSAFEEEDKEIADKRTQFSIFGKQISFRGIGRAQASVPGREYLEIVASQNNTQPINITEWQLKSAVTGRQGKIGKGVYLLYSGQVNVEQQIFLSPGERAFIITGRSPKGVSFRLNTCTGYFEQFQDFTPALPKECPRPIDEDLPIGPNGLNDQCIDYIETLPRCTAHVKGLPSFLADNPVCQEYIGEFINYSGCIKIHKNDSDFYKPKWRIFLGRNQELWKQKRETILLLDDKGKVVDSVSY